MARGAGCCEDQSAFLIALSAIGFCVNKAVGRAQLPGAYFARGLQRPLTLFLTRLIWRCCKSGNVSCHGLHVVPRGGRKVRCNGNHGSTCNPVMLLPAVAQIKGKSLLGPGQRGG